MSVMIPLPYFCLYTLYIDTEVSWRREMFQHWKGTLFFFFDLLQLHLMTLPWIECYYVLVSIETKLQKNKRHLMARKYFGYAYCC